MNHWILLLGVSLVCWGVWPSFRQLCGAPIAAFATLNICSQFLTATVYLLALGDPSAAAHALQHPNLRTAAVLLGGFSLGHADQLSALAMGYLPAAVAYPLYAGISLVLAQALNYAQTGSKEPGMLLLGLALVLLGLILLTATQSAKEAGDTKTQSLQRTTTRERDVTQRLLEAQLLGDAQSTAAIEKKIGVSSRLAMVICLFAGLSGSGWPPLSTYARAAAGGADSEALRDPLLCLWIFQLGQLCALPSITTIGGTLTQTGIIRPIRALTLRSAAWGVICGASVATGYYAFYTSSAHISPTVSFGIVACNPVHNDPCQVHSLSNPCDSPCSESLWRWCWTF